MTILENDDLCKSFPLSDPPKSFLTPIEISKILGAQAATIRKAIKRGEIPARKIGRFFYVPNSFFELGQETCDVPQN